MPRAKKTLSKKSVSLNEIKEIEYSKKNTPAFFKSSTKIIILIVIFFLAGAFIFKNKHLFLAGMINYRPVTSLELYNRMVKQSGKQTFEQMIVEKLILSEAKKRNINVTQTEIDQDVSEIEKGLGQNISLNDALAQQGMTISDLHDQVRLRLTANKLVETNLTATDEEIAKYITDNKDFLPKDQDEKTQKEEVAKILKNQKASTAIQKLIEELKSAAKIKTFL